MKTIDDYANLIRKLERRASKHPLVYRLQLAGLLLLGVGFLALMFLFAVVLTLGVLGLIIVSKGAALKLIKIIWVPVVLGYMILKALWVRVPAPEGRQIRRREAPELFRAIDEARKAQKAQRIHRVILTDEYNAAVSRVPMLGILGFHRNYLILGVPLLASLSQDEFRAVLAHEFGHLAGNHTFFGNLIYRMRTTWYQLQAAFEARQQWGAGLIRRFLQWYAPYFNAYSFVLARENEYEADAAAARFTDKHTAGAALVAVHTKAAGVIDPFWSAVVSMADDRPEPPANVYLRLVEQSKQTGSGDIEQALEQAMALDTDLNDTHPALKDRLAALEVTPQPPQPLTVSAAEVLLAGRLPALCEELSLKWRQSVHDSWLERHQFVCQARARLEELQSVADRHNLSGDEAYERASLAEQLHGTDAAEALYHSAYEQSPEHPGVRFAMGRIMIARGEHRGADLLERLVEENEQAIGPAAELLWNFYHANGCEEKARSVVDRYDAWQAKQAAAAAERDNLTADDVVEPHDLDEARLAQWRAALDNEPDVKRAWLVRKKMSHYPESPCFLMVIQFKAMVRKTDQIRQRLADDLSKESVVWVMNENAKAPVHKLIKRAKRVPDALIYRR